LVREALNLATSSLEAVILLPSLSLDLPSSSRWKRAFSRRKTVPSAGLAQAASTSSPTQSFKKVTGLPRSFSTSAATGLRVYFGFGAPFGRPR